VVGSLVEQQDRGRPAIRRRSYTAAGRYARSPPAHPPGTAIPAEGVSSGGSQYEEVAVPVVLVFEGVTQEQYEESVRRLTGGKTRMESPADWPVEGLLAHIPGQGEKGFRVVDVWESEEALNSFAEKLMPILQDIGVQGQPEIYAAHTYVSA
jgi:hypothetical protein